MIPGAGLLGVLAFAAGAIGDHPIERNAAAEVLVERGGELGIPFERAARAATSEASVAFSECRRRGLARLSARHPRRVDRGTAGGAEAVPRGEQGGARSDRLRAGTSGARLGKGRGGQEGHGEHSRPHAVAASAERPSRGGPRRGARRSRRSKRSGCSKPPGRSLAPPRTAPLLITQLLAVASGGGRRACFGSSRALLLRGSIVSRATAPGATCSMPTRPMPEPKESPSLAPSSDPREEIERKAPAAIAAGLKKLGPCEGASLDDEGIWKLAERELFPSSDPVTVEARDVYRETTLPNMVNPVRRAARLAVDRELTLEILRLRLAKEQDAEGRWPARMETVVSTACPSAAYVYRANAGGMEIRFEGAAPAPAAQFLLPLSFRGAARTKADGLSDPDVPSLDTHTGRRDDRPAMTPRSVSNCGGGGRPGRAKSRPAESVRAGQNPDERIRTPGPKGSGVFDLMDRRPPDPGVHRVARAERRRGREAARGARARRTRTPSSSGWTWRTARSRRRRCLLSTPRPVILTWRSLAEGGNFSGSAEEYARLVEERYAAGATVDVEHARGLLADERRFPDREPRHRVAPLSLLAARRLEGEGRGDESSRSARAVKMVAGVADVSAGLRIAELQRDTADPSRRDLPDGADERSRPRALGALRRRARLRAGRTGDGRRARFRSATCFRSTRWTGRARSTRSSASSPEARRARSRHTCTTRSSARATCPISTCRSRSPTSPARVRTRSLSILRSAASPSRSRGSSKRRARASPSEDVRSIGASNTLVRDTRAAGGPRTPTSTASSIRWPTTAPGRGAAPSSWGRAAPRGPSSWRRGASATRSPSRRGATPRRTGWRKR